MKTCVLIRWQYDLCGWLLLLSFDLCCKLIIISEDDITAQIKRGGGLTKKPRLKQGLGHVRFKSWQGKALTFGLKELRCCIGV